MNLRQLIDNEVQIDKEIFIGKEIELLDESSLLLSIQEGTFLTEDGLLEPATKLILLHETIEDEDEWDDEEDFWDEDEDEVMTHRQELLEMIDDSGDVTMVDACSIQINGKEYAVFETEEKWMCDLPYDGVLALKRAAEHNAIPDSWLEKENDNLELIEYIVDPAIAEVDWNVDILPMEIAFMAEGEEILVGKVLKLPCERLDVPVTFELRSPASDAINVKVYGTYLLDIWKDAACLDLDFSDLEEICARDEKLLVVEYSTDSDAEVALNFYTKDFLDAPADDEDMPLLMLGTAEHELRLLEVVPGDYNSEVELELLSFEVFED